MTLIAAPGEVGDCGAPPTILLVEDESFVRQAAAAALRLSGYTVLTAADGAQALEACRNYPRPIDLLLSDLVMPHLNGRELAETFQAMHPRGRVLLMSGYAEELVPYISFPHCTPFLRKPFSVDTLRKAVGELCDADALSAAWAHRPGLH